MYRLIVSELAHEDLDRIISYIAYQLLNSVAAANLLDEIEKSYMYLKSTPYMYERCQDSHLEREGYHKVTINNYVLIYKVDEAIKTVVIYRFFYGAQNYIQLI